MLRSRAAIGAKPRIDHFRWAAMLLATLASAYLLCVVPQTAVALTEGSGSIALFADPALPDGALGWSRSPKTIRMVPLSPGTLYYTWDDTFAPWQRVRGPILAPEGGRVLHVRLVQAQGELVDAAAFPIRVDYGLSPTPPTASTVSVAGAGSVIVRVTVNPVAGPRIVRLGGIDRYETAAIASAHNFPQARTVILATGTDFADALSSSGLAGVYSGPVLLTRPNVLPNATRAEILRLGVSEVVIVGGTGAVHPAVANAISRMGVTVRRIGGVDRYETSTMIASEVLVRRSGSRFGGQIFFARGDLFADAVCLGPLAYSSRTPIVLVRPDSVPATARDFLARNTFSSGVVAGGVGAVSERAFRELRTGVPDLTRAAGQTRYDTAVAVASWGVARGIVEYTTVGVATGEDFADALAGGVAVGTGRGVVLLSTRVDLHKSADTAIRGAYRDIRELQVFGGPAAISIESQRILSAMSRR